MKKFFLIPLMACLMCATAWADGNVAKIVTTEYATFAEATSAVTDGQTIQLLADCDLNGVWQISGEEVTLDLNGKTLTRTGSGSAFRLKYNAKLTVMDGTATTDPTISGTTITYTSGKINFGTSGLGVECTSGAELVVNSGWLVAQEAVAYVYGTGKVTVNNGVLESRDNGVIMGNGSAGKGGYTMTVNGGILLGHIQTAGYASMVIYHPNEGTLNITGGTLVSENGPAIVVRSGEVNISGGIITALGSGSGKCGDGAAQIESVGVVCDFNSSYPNVATTDVNITAGTVSGEAGAVEAIYADAEPTETEKDAVAVSGGTFNTALDDNVCADGFAPKDNGNGTYTATDEYDYSREVTSGYFGTICLNKAAKFYGGELYEIGSLESNTLYLDELGTNVMEAGKPYIFVSSAAKVGAMYTGTEEVAAGTNNGLVGSYSEDPVAQGNYIIKDNKYWVVDGDNVNVGANCAYIVPTSINSTSAAPGRRRISMSMHTENTATGVDNAENATQSVKMIENGQVIIIRNGVKYNAAGQMVK